MLHYVCNGDCVVMLYVTVFLRIKCLYVACEYKYIIIKVRSLLHFSNISLLHLSGS